MKIYSIVCFLIALFNLTALSAQKNAPFKIAGNIIGYENGTKLYLNNVSNGNYHQIDSTIINNNSFSFNGVLSKQYIRANISTTDFTDRATFWLEKGLTTFTAVKHNFTRATITGAIIQADQNKLNRMLDTAKNTEETEYHFIKNNPSSVISGYILSVYSNSWGKDTVSSLYRLLTKKVKSTVYARKIYDYITLNKNLSIGDHYIDFKQKDSSGKNVRLSHFKSKLLLLEFWGSWCGPCREENPSLVKIYTEFNSRGFEILGVATESDKQKWKNAIKEDGLIWTNVTDGNGSANKAAIIYGVSGYPSNFLINKQGIIIAKDIYGDKLKTELSKNL